MSKHGESGLFDPMMGDAVEASVKHDAEESMPGYRPEDDIGPPAPGEGDDLPNPELEMEC